jgi:hypothetical protein
VPQIDPLDPGWLKSPPPSDATVKDALRKHVEQLRSSLKNILASPEDGRPDKVVERTKEIAALSDSVDKTLAAGQISTWTVNAIAELKAFESEIRVWRVVIPSALTDDSHSNARTRFSDAGAWAMHFSTVRLSLTTFFITASWGLVTLKWKEYSDELRNAALVSWLLATFFLDTFTRATIKASEKQKGFQFELPTLTEASSDRTLHWKTRLGIWFPGIVFVIMTMGFAFLLDCWRRTKEDKPVNWSAILSEPITRDAKRSMLPTDALAKDGQQPMLHSVNFAEWSRKLDSISESLKKIEGRLADLKPTPTPPPTPTVTPAATGASPSPAKIIHHLRSENAHEGQG